jgi:hypothetical protein
VIGFPRTLVGTLAALALASSVRAQGSLSVQGYGYPPGQLSSQAMGMGGSIAEFDPLSPINPASLMLWSRAGLYFQYEPEFRTVTTPTKSDGTRTARFPLVIGAAKLGERAMLGFSASTLLDRSSESSFQATEVLGTDTVAFTERFRALGSISDLRLAAAWALSSKLSLGVGGHVYVGQNQLLVSRLFADSQTIGNIEVERDLSFTGTALSAGLQWNPSRYVSFGASGRVGGGLRARSNDTTVSRGSAPDRFGAGIRVSSGGGFSLAARADFTGWSKIVGLGTESLVPNDAWDIGVGAEIGGPRVLGAPSLLRVGGRRRTLPFEASGHEVTETAFSGGLGLPIAAGRASFDLAVQHARRSAAIDIKERAWTVSIGLAIRP